MGEVKFLYHGTTLLNWRNIMTFGFEPRPIMFSDSLEVASDYAKMYCRNGNASPQILQINAYDFFINYDGLFQREYDFIVENYKLPGIIAEAHKLDGYLSDSNAGYYVFVNIASLNHAMKDSKIKAWKLT